MLIDKAVDNFFVNMIGFKVKKQSDLFYDRLFISNIFLSYDSKDISYDIIFQKELLEDVAKVMFMEDVSDRESLIDLNNEVANLIIGNLKVLLSDSLNISDDIELSTPRFVGEVSIKMRKKYDKLYNYLINGYYFAVGEEVKVKAL